MFDPDLPQSGVEKHCGRRFVVRPGGFSRDGHHESSHLAWLLSPVQQQQFLFFGRCQPLLVFPLRIAGIRILPNLQIVKSRDPLQVKR